MEREWAQTNSNWARLVVAGLQLLLRWWGLVGSNTTLHLHERFASGIIHEATPTKLKQTKSSESSRVDNFKRNKADGVEIQNATTASSRNLIGPFAHPNWVTAKLHYRFLLLRSKRLSITINSAHYPKWTQTSRHHMVPIKKGKKNSPIKINLQKVSSQKYYRIYTCTKVTNIQI